MLFLQPSLSDLLASHSSELLSFFAFVVIVVVLYLFLMLWYGLFGCVLVPDTLAFRLFYLDESPLQ